MKREVLWPIVLLVSVYMMHHFASLKLPAEFSLHNHAVFANIAVRIGAWMLMVQYQTVSVFDRKPSGVCFMETRPRAELLYSDTASKLERLAAITTCDEPHITSVFVAAIVAAISTRLPRPSLEFNPTTETGYNHHSVIVAGQGGDWKRPDRPHIQLA